jgi:hypothetical protein
MAIAVPIIMAYSGATAAISTAIGLTAAVGATAGAAIVGIGTGLVMQATGVNDKINRAASKVFGEDVVKVANIAGSIALAAGAFSPSANTSSLDSSNVGELGDASPPTVDVPPADEPPVLQGGGADGGADANGMAGVREAVGNTDGLMDSAAQAPSTAGVQSNAPYRPSAQAANSAQPATVASNAGVNNSVLADSAARTPGYGPSSAGAPQSMFDRLLANKEATGALAMAGGNLLSGVSRGYMESQAMQYANKPSANSGYTGYGYRPYDDVLARRIQQQQAQQSQQRGYGYTPGSGALKR